MEIKTRGEVARLCGYREPGKDGVGVYLMGEGSMEVCERLPFPLEKCPHCGMPVRQSRGFTKISPHKLFAPGKDPVCRELDGHRHAICSMCAPPKSGYLLWVGARYYTPEDFIEEAQHLGISKKVGRLPKELKITTLTG